MKKAEKSIFVDNLTQELKEAKSIVLVNYSGLSVKAQQELKKRLKEQGGKMIVVKNSLLKRAGEKAKIDPETMTDEILSGQNALIVATGDAIAPIQVLGQYAKEFEVPQMRVGVVEGLFQNSSALTKIANLPSKEVLLAQVLGSLTAPLYNLTGLLGGNLNQLVAVLNAKVKSAN